MVKDHPTLEESKWKAFGQHSEMRAADPAKRVEHLSYTLLHGLVAVSRRAFEPFYRHRDVSARDRGRRIIELRPEIASFGGPLVPVRCLCGIPLGTPSRLKAAHHQIFSATGRCGRARI